GARPDASVVAFPPVTEPAPEATAKVTPTPPTALPYWSVTRTVGAAATFVFTVALWLSPASTDMVVAAPAVTVRDAVPGAPSIVPVTVCPPAAVIVQTAA